MKTKRTSVIVAMSLASTLLGCASAPALQNQDTSASHVDPSAIELPFCHFEVPEFVKDGNASFYVMFKFKVDTKGHAIDLEAPNLRYVDLEAISKCVESWNLPSGSSIAVVQYWKHAVGWEWMQVTGLGQSITIKNLGNPSPYQSCESP